MLKLFRKTINAQRETNDTMNTRARYRREKVALALNNTEMLQLLRQLHIVFKDGVGADGRSVAEVSKVSSNRSVVQANMTDSAQNHIAANVFMGLPPDWSGAATQARMQKYLDETWSATTHSSIDEYFARLTPSPNNGSSQDGSDTAKCSSRELHEEDIHRLEKLRWALDEADRDNVELYAQCEHVNAQVQQSREEYAELKAKYEMQLTCRRNDKTKLDEAYRYYQAAEGDRADLEEKLDAVAIEHDHTVEQLQAQLVAKEPEVAKLQNNHQCAIVVLEGSYQRDLAAKEEELLQAKALVVDKEVELKSVIKKTADERRDYKVKVRKEKQKLIKAANTHRKAADEKQESMEQRINILTADCTDALKENESQMISLVSRNQQLEKEHRCMSDMLNQGYPCAEDLHEIIDNNYAGLAEEKESRARIKQLKEQNENLLDKIQQMEAHYTKHQNAEQNAVLESNRRQYKIFDLEDRIARQREQILDAAEQFDQTKSNNTSSEEIFAGIFAIERENEALRQCLIKERLDKEDVQKEANKFDAETLRLSVAYECLEADMIELKREYDHYQDRTATSLEELELLHDVLKNSKDPRLGKEKIQVVWSWMSNKTKEVDNLVAENHELTKQFEALQKHAQSETTEWSKGMDNMNDYIEKLQFWFYNEAVSTTQRLHNEIHALKAEKGESHWIEPAQPANTKVADRNVLRCAAMCDFDGVDPANIPSAVHNPKFIRDSIPATYEALLALRPQGFQTHWNAGKVWMKREFEPVSEEDAITRLQIQEQEAKDERDRSTEALQRSLLGMPSTSMSCSKGANLVSEVVKQIKPVPPQVIDPAIINKPVVRTFGAGVKNAAMQKSKARLAQRPVVQGLPSTELPWESRFANFPDMTKEEYDEMDSEMRQYFINDRINKGRKV
jgi:hypothetical protein